MNIFVNAVAIILELTATATSNQVFEAPPFAPAPCHTECKPPFATLNEKQKRSKIVLEFVRVEKRLCCRYMGK